MNIGPKVHQQQTVVLKCILYRWRCQHSLSIWIWNVVVSLVDDCKWFWWSPDFQLKDPLNQSNKTSKFNGWSDFALQREGATAHLLSILFREHLSFFRCQLYPNGHCSYFNHKDRKHQVYHLIVSVSELLCNSDSEWCCGKNLLAVNKSSVLTDLSLPRPCGAADHGGWGSGCNTWYFIMTGGHEMYIVLYNSNFIRQ